MMRVAVLTTGRQDWGILRSTCVALRDDSRFELRLLAGGMCCEPRYGSVLAHLESDGFEAAETMRWVGADEDAPAHVQAGQALAAIGDALERQRPDLLLLVGDRFETAAAAMAATIARVPIAHLHGGEETAGAFDNALRHAVTKLAHLHLVSHADHAKRVIAMGEAPDTVYIVGAPGLDNLRRTDLADRAELEATLGIALEPPVVLVTLHPATLGASAETEATAVLSAMNVVDATYVMTLPNADPGSREIRTRFQAAADRPRRCAVEALGERRYFGLLRVADAMLGNSSSGIIEAPVVRLPVVNVGSRQDGRLRSDNVIDTQPDAEAITQALQRALSEAFRTGLRADSPLGDGLAGERIIAILAAYTPPSPPRKPTVAIS